MYPMTVCVDGVVELVVPVAPSPTSPNVTPSTYILKADVLVEVFIVADPINTIRTVVVLVTFLWIISTSLPLWSDVNWANPRSIGDVVQSILYDYSNIGSFLWYNRGMSNKIVQLENESGDNLYPIAGGALTGSISKTMLEEGIFAGPELSEPSSVAYVATDNIQDGAVTSDKIDSATLLKGDVTLASGYNISVLSTEAIAKKVAGVVYFYHGISCPALTTTDNQTVAFTLPVGWRPVDVVNFITQCGVGKLCRIRIHPDGTVKISKYDSDTGTGEFAQLQACSYITYY